MVSDSLLFPKTDGSHFRNADLVYRIVAQNDLGDPLTAFTPFQEILLTGKKPNFEDPAVKTENTVVMGECSHCGHHQPGIQSGNTVVPLADDGCVKCENQNFRVAETEEKKSTSLVLAR